MQAHLNNGDGHPCLPQRCRLPSEGGVWVKHLWAKNIGQRRRDTEALDEFPGSRPRMGLLISED
jgi:hypothetical protein